ITITSSGAHTIGCTQPKDFMDAATFSTADLLHLRAFLGYGFGRSMGHQITVRVASDVVGFPVFTRPPFCSSWRNTSPIFESSQPWGTFLKNSRIFSDGQRRFKNR